MKNLLKNLLSWSIYSLGFYLTLMPLHCEFKYSCGFWILISILIGFFAGLLNEISSTLKSINNQLRGKA
jgi:hypothetical protein